MQVLTRPREGKSLAMRCGAHLNGREPLLVHLETALPLTLLPFWHGKQETVKHRTKETAQACER